MEAERTVLVVGATGKQGRSTVKFLLEPDQPASPAIKFKALALTRDTSSECARQLLERNKQHVNIFSLVQGDLDKPDSIRKAFQDAASSHGRGIWGVFVALAYPRLGESAEGGSKQAKVGPSEEDHLDNSHRAKPRIENCCGELGYQGLNWIIIRPGFFMENFDGFLGAITVSGMRAGLDKDTTINLVLLQSLKASEDIGRVAAGVLMKHDKHLHKTLAITSEAATMEHISESYKRATGRPIPAVPILVGKSLVKINAALQDVYVP
ncbi:hypothetical protein INS49_003105 [Diaporthe citri]|uniref:uncharacterized protein n=1 Tax=Diaporthe citri TaxID=83186 RepID=UPI001C826DF3|nr:uncharacterized protein INS49_003105 [Diaporthe citri]KAG6368887.1 hypothetical protein INS49_003105 [Diaporthe citri]